MYISVYISNKLSHEHGINNKTWQMKSKKITIRTHSALIKKLWLFKYWKSVIQIYISCIPNLHNKLIISSISKKIIKIG